MRWIDSPTERTSAATDVLLALVAAACTAAARGAPGLDPGERLLWTILFAAAAAAALAGAAYHGLRLPGPCRARLWRAVTAALALAAAALCGLLHLALDALGPYHANRHNLPFLHRLQELGVIQLLPGLSGGIQAAYDRDGYDRYE